jgi:hypothetical protein
VLAQCCFARQAGHEHWSGGHTDAHLSEQRNTVAARGPRRSSAARVAQSLAAVALQYDGRCTEASGPYLQQGPQVQAQHDDGVLRAFSSRAVSQCRLGLAG